MPTESLTAGLLLTLSLAALAWFGSGYLGFDPITPALLLGVIAGNLPVVDARFQAGIRWVAMRVLEASVVLLGLKLDASALLAVGGTGLILTIGSLLLAIGSADWLGRRVSLSKPLCDLVGIGSGVCGSSAIAAAAPVLGGRPQETGIALGAIYVVGTVSLFTLPPITAALGLDPRDAGVIVGGSLQSMGHVVAAGFALGEEAGPLAVTVKLARVALLPLVVVVMAAGRPRPRSAGLIPAFLLLFCLAALLRSVGVVPDALAAPIGLAGKAMVTWAMVGVGARIRFKDLWADGPAAIGLAFAVAGLQIAWLGAGLALGM